MGRYGDILNFILHRKEDSLMANKKLSDFFRTFFSAVIAVSFMAVPIFFLVSGCDIADKSIKNIFEKKAEPELVEKTPNVKGKLSLTEGDRLSNVAEKAVKGVVNVSSVKVIRYPQRQFSPFQADPFFRHFFGDDFSSPFNIPRERREQSLGSGVVVGKNGYILTNNHVIQDAEEVKVFLHDGREKTAEIVGADPKTDIAVLKIELETGEQLDPVSLGNSDRLRLGEVVLAIGNPFGVGQTVTMGIISATGRANVGVADYEDFIQTDAAINPGNSGGALVNMNGELIGINTAIYSRSGGYQGIGFAVPVNMARSVMDSLVRFGKVERGYLGVMIQNVSPDMAKVFDLDKPKGALISDVVEDSPAEKAGLKRGDIIFEMDGKEVEDAADLRNMVAQTSIGTKVDLGVVRDGKRIGLTAKIERATETGEQPEVVEEKISNRLKGVSVKELTVIDAQRLGIDPKTKGVIVTSVKAGSRAGRAGLKAGDVMMEINRMDISDVGSYEEALKKSRGKNLVILINRNGQTFFVAIR